MNKPIRNKHSDQQRADKSKHVAWQCFNFVPAFLDTCTGQVYLSRFDDERIAPIHLHESLPAELLQKNENTGQATMLKASVTAGFVHRGRFVTRQQAALQLGDPGTVAGWS